MAARVTGRGELGGQSQDNYSDVPAHVGNKRIRIWEALGAPETTCSPSGSPESTSWPASRRVDRTAAELLCRQRFLHRFIIVRVDDDDKMSSSNEGVALTLFGTAGR